MIYKILVALDYSEISQLVFDEALALAKSTSATLMIAHILVESEPVYPVIPSYNYYPVLDSYDYYLSQKEFADLRQKSIRFLQEKAIQAKTAGVRTEFIQLTGNPGQKICNLGNTWSADLILVGSRGLKGLKEIFLGSVSNYVMHHAPCSVLIVRTDVDAIAEANHPLDQESVEVNSRQEVATDY